MSSPPQTVFRLSQSHPHEPATEAAVGAGLHATGATTAKPCWEPIISSTRMTSLDGATTGSEMYAGAVSRDKQTTVDLRDTFRKPVGRPSQPCTRECSSAISHHENCNHERALGPTEVGKGDTHVGEVPTVRTSRDNQSSRDKPKPLHPAHSRGCLRTRGRTLGAGGKGA